MPTAILIVEDDPVQRSLIEAAVRASGHVPTGAAGTDAAIGALSGRRGKRIGLVILGLETAGARIDDILRRMRNAAPLVPVMVAAATDEAGEAAVHAGAADFVLKPVTPGRIERAIASALRPDETGGGFVRLRRQDSDAANSGDDALPSGAVQAPDATVPAFADGEVRRLEEVEADMIRLALRHYGGRLALVARRLGIGRSTLYRKLRDAGISAPDEGVAAE